MALTNTQRIRALEKAVAALTVRVSSLEDPPSTPPDPPTPPTPVSAWTLGLAYFQSLGVRPDVPLVVSAGITVTQPGAVIEGKDFTGPVVVSAAGVVLRNCRFAASINVNAANVTIEDCTMRWSASGGGIWADTVSGLVVRRVNASGFHEHFRLGSGATLDEVYSHNLTTPNTSTHCENVMSGGGLGTIIRNCWIDSDGAGLPARSQMTGAINMSGWAGPFTGWQVTGNHLVGDGYLLGPGRGNSNTYRGNTFTTNGPGCYGAVYPTALSSGDVWENNRTVPGDSLVPPPK